MPLSAGEPVLPPELQHAIVSLVTEDIRFPVTPKTCYINLQLTSRAFKECTLPSLFRVLATSFLFSHFQRSDSHLMEALVKYGKYTTHLSYHINGPQGLSKADMVKLAKILQLCPNIEDLMLSQGWHLPVDMPPSTIAALYEAVISLSKLRCYWGIIGDGRQIPQRLPAPTCHLGITHLVVMVGRINIDLILQFKNLTHIAIYFNWWSRGDNLTHWIARIINPENGLSSLKLLVAISPFDGTPDFESEDRRFIEIRTTSYLDYGPAWLICANGDVDLWDFSERIMIARQRGYMIHSGAVQVSPAFEIKSELTGEGQVWWEERNRQLNIK